MVGFEGLYEVSDFGRVRGLNRSVPIRDARIITGYHMAAFKGRMLKPSNKRSQCGHLSVTLGAGTGIQKRCSVHVLVLEAFIGPCPYGKESCHKDDDPSNNHKTNLYWGTRSQNLQDAARNGKRNSVLVALRDPKRRKRHSELMTKIMKDRWALKKGLL